MAECQYECRQIAWKAHLAAFGFELTPENVEGSLVPRHQTLMSAKWPVT